jgi:hypothetical protein
MRLRRGELQPGPERDTAAGQTRRDSPAAERSERRVLLACRAVAAGLIVALAAAGYAATLAKESAPAASGYASALICAALLGVSYYLGRTRPAPGAAQRLNTAGKILSVIPLFGLIFIPTMGGLYHRTRRRLYLRNLAIFMATGLVELSFGELSSHSRSVPGMIASVLGLAAAVLAVILCRRMPSATSAAATAQPATPIPKAHQTTERAQVPPSRPEQADMPEADQTMDVTPLSAAARRLYWLCGAVKFGAIFLALGLLAPDNGLHLRSGNSVAAAAAIVAVFTGALLVQEARIRPARGVGLALSMIAVICFAAVGLGALTAAQAWSGLLGWVIWPPLFLWLYRRQRRTSGLTDAEIQAASRVGHLPRHAPRGGSRPFPSVVVWLCAAAGVLLAIPVVVIGLLNTVLNAPVISDWIQWPLDKLFESARRWADVLLAGVRGEQPRIVLASPEDAASWSLFARGDLAHWGKLGPQRVSFDEFLEARLDAYGEVQRIGEASGSQAGASAVVMPVGAPIDDEVLTKVAELGSQLPLLLVAQPAAGSGPLARWPELSSRLRSHGIEVPTLADPVHTIAVLHSVIGENVVYLAAKRHQWSYVAAIHLALGEVGASGTTAAAAAPAAPSDSQPHRTRGQDLPHWADPGQSQP